MKLTDTLLLSIKNLFRHKLRTLLTISGVMIGTCAIMIMLSLGIAMNRNFLEQINQMGNIMQITVYHYNQGGKTPDGKDIPPLDDDMVARLEKMDGVEGVAPIFEINVKMMAGKYVGHVSIMGIEPRMFDILDIPVNGRPLQEGDTNQMVFGRDVMYNFYNPRAVRWEPIPEDFDITKEKLTISWDMNYGEKPQPGMEKPKVQAKPVKVEVVGTVDQLGSEYSWRILMPMDTVKKYQKEIEKYNRQNGGSNGGGGFYGGVRIMPMYASGGKEQEGYYQVIVKAKSMDDVVPIMEKIKELGYECFSPVQILEEMQKQSAGLRQILLGIGIMSFVIAAIGIANTMYMSIYERTREIGIFKVIGARLNDIRRLFMMEAWWIGVFGGIFGIFLSFGMSYLLNKFNVSLGGSIIWTPDGQKTLPSSVIPFWLPIAALIFAPLASLLAGLLPSRRAMKLSVMKALRQD